MKSNPSVFVCKHSSDIPTVPHWAILHEKYISGMYDDPGEHVWYYTAYLDEELWKLAIRTATVSKSYGGGFVALKVTPPTIITTVEVK